MMRRMKEEKEGELGEERKVAEGARRKDIRVCTKRHGSHQSYERQEVIY